MAGARWRERSQGQCRRNASTVPNQAKRLVKCVTVLPERDRVAAAHERVHAVGADERGRRCRAPLDAQWGAPKSGVTPAAAGARLQQDGAAEGGRSRQSRSHR